LDKSGSMNREDDPMGREEDPMTDATGV